MSKPLCPIAEVDQLEKIIRPIVEGQIRGFLKEHPVVAASVNWFKPRADKETTFVNSLAKRIVRDLICDETRGRIEDALFEIWESEKSGVASRSAPDPATAGTLAGVAANADRATTSAADAARVELVTARAMSASLLPEIQWGTA